LPSGFGDSAEPVDTVDANLLTLAADDGSGTAAPAITLARRPAIDCLQWPGFSVPFCWASGLADRPMKAPNTRQGNCI